MHFPVAGLGEALLAQSDPQAGAMGGLVSMAPILLMVLIFYFIVLRPARKERNEHQAMLSALKRGDEVITNSGLVGTISDLQEPFVTLEIARNVKVRMLKSAVQKRTADLKQGPAKPAETTDKKEEAKS